ALEGFETTKPPAGRIADAAPLAREAAASAAVLLRNDGVLPLAADRLGRIAVIGPGAKDARALGGGSASVPLPYVVAPFSGLRDALAGRAEVVTAVGTLLSDKLRPVRADELDGPVLLRWVDADGATLAEQVVGTVMIIRLLDDVPEGAAGLEIRTAFSPDEDGEWRIGVVGPGRCTLEIDGVPVLDETVEPRDVDVHQVFAQPPQHATSRHLRGGERVDVVLRYRWPANGFLFRVGLVVGAPVLGPAEELARAVELARGSDVAVVVVGTSEDGESEGFDRTSLALPGRQDELVRAVAAVNPRTVVV